MSSRNDPDSGNRVMTRSVHIRGAGSYDQTTRSVEVVATTELPVVVYDWERDQYINEVLLMSGCVVPGDQVPLLDSHNRWSVDDVLGSFRAIITGEEKGYKAKVGRVFFSARQAGKDLEQDVRDGHVTDFSVGYSRDKKLFISEGCSETVDGTVYEGPMVLVTQWTLKELSATPIGADPLAKARKEALQGGKNMPDVNEETKKPGVETGDGKRTEDSGKAAANGEGNSSEDSGKAAAANGKEAETPMDQRSINTAVQEAIRAERQRSDEIINRCKVARLGEDFARKLISDEVPLEEASRQIFAEMGKSNPPVGAGRYEMGTDSADKFRAAVSDGLLFRSGLKLPKPAPGYEDFRGRTLSHISRVCLERCGIDTRHMTRKQIAAMVISPRSVIGLSASDFPHILANVANKRLQAAYAEYPATWRQFVSIGDASDFKEIFGVKFSESPDLDLIGQNGEYKEGVFSEQQESYFLKSYGKVIYLSRVMIINDDLRAFSRIPSLFGAAARRKEGDIVWGLITANPTMNDGHALFSADHGNLASGAAVGVVSSTTLDTGRVAMRKQTGLNGSTLDIQPAYIAVPVEQETDTDILIRSTALPADNKSSGVYNPWNGKLIPIAEPRLSAADPKAWYLIASPTQTETIEVAYLEGEQQPYVEEDTLFDRDGIGIKVRHDFGAGVMDHVGLYRNPGE